MATLSASRIIIGSPMSVSFHAQLLADALADAGDIFIRRCQELNPPQGGLSHVLELDTRLDAHLDLLFYGGAGSVSVCASNEDMSAGPLYVAGRTMMRLGQWEVWRQLANEVANVEDDPERLKAGEPKVAQALAAAAGHEDWAGDLSIIETTLSSGGDSALGECFAYAAGYHRWNLAGALSDGLNVGVKAPAMWLWALGQIGEAQARDTLLRFLESPDPEVAGAAAMGL